MAIFKKYEHQNLIMLFFSRSGRTPKFRCAYFKSTMLRPDLRIIFFISNWEDLISGIWKDVLDFSFATHYFDSWREPRVEYLPQVPYASRRTIWTLWCHLEQCICRSFKFRSRN